MDFFIKKSCELDSIINYSVNGVVRVETPVSVEYQGEQYTKLAEVSSPLSPAARVGLVFKTVLLTVFSLGLALISKTMRENWTSVFTGKLVKVIYGFSEKVERLAGKIAVKAHRHVTGSECHLLEGKQDRKKYEMAWNLNFALLRDIYENCSDPEQREQIRFLANNFLEKNAPEDVPYLENFGIPVDACFQTGPFAANMRYNRDAFRQNRKLSESINQDFGLGKKSPLVLTDTIHSDQFFPLKFTVLACEQSEKKLADQMADVLCAHFQKYENCREGFSEALSKDFILDFTALLENEIKTHGNGDQEEKFEELLSLHKERIEVVMDSAIKKVVERHPSLVKDKSQIVNFLKDNITPICRVGMENMGPVGGIKVLPLFFSLEEQKIEERHEKFIDFIYHTGLGIGAVNTRRYVLNAFALDKDVRYAVRRPFLSEHVVLYPTKRDFAPSLLKRLSEKFATLSPPFRILGASTMKVLDGLLNEISDEKWEELNADPQKREIFQTTLLKLQNNLATAELSLEHFNDFAQELELAQYEIATLLELMKPFQYEDFAEIYKERLDFIPEELRPLVRANLGKTSVNTFAAVNAALHKDRPNFSKTAGKGQYYEQMWTVGDEYHFDKVMNDPSIQRVDLYAGAFNPNIDLDPNQMNYEQSDIIGNVRRILREKTGTQHLTITVDGTIEYINSEKNRELLLAFEKEIQEGRLNFVFFNSGQKFDMFGMDHYYGSPYYIINNGGQQWNSVNSILSNEAHTTDLLSLQWFCLATRYAADAQDDYRRLIYENSRQIMHYIPESLKAQKGTVKSMQIGTIDDKMAATFIDIKLRGSSKIIGVRARALVKKFYKKLFENSVKAVRRASFGFYHPNITLIPDGDCYSIRINPGLNPKDNRAIVDFILELDKRL